MRELRYNPLLGQWIMVSAEREKRPWRPKDFCPFCPGGEETGYGWEVLLLPNRFPMLSFNTPKPESKEFYKKARALGQCSVIVETPEHELKDLEELPIEQMTKVVQLWRQITGELKNTPHIAYLSIFRNKGEEIGVSLTHPHGQLYALPFIPLKVRVKIGNSRRYYDRFKKCLFCKILDEELKGERLIYENNDFILFLPFFANWPFEVHIYPKRHVQWLTQLTQAEILNLADILRVTTGTLNSLFERQMPYVMSVYQAPFKGEYPFYHLHIEFYPLLREKDKLKYAAGIEMGTWEFTYDGIPEENARKLREVCKKIKDKIDMRGKCI
ncbi:MAG: galactose-1-phosphate uridylyltransferase [Thermococcus sp.]|uniref:galactose-1-phosphate uridylyltransferase n=2 Tax=Thermococcus sp. TaxID=35749 RepID=UPI000F1D0628|nr:galactose-1-phosphate uridylyltransferase [Thermococcus sp.]MCD6140954.1 galactose-1-phosphate uridylyltransferase [Thermococcus sp.]RLF80962.1 MAG: galactose-1-phosphate uridylyltransferase [Thermococci archaeon]